MQLTGEQALHLRRAILDSCKDIASQTTDMDDVEDVDELIELLQAERTKLGRPPADGVTAVEFSAHRVHLTLRAEDLVKRAATCLQDIHKGLKEHAEAMREAATGAAIFHRLAALDD